MKEMIEIFGIKFFMWILYYQMEEARKLLNPRNYPLEEAKALGAAGIKNKYALEMIPIVEDVIMVKQSIGSPTEKDKAVITHLKENYLTDVHNV